MKQKQLTKPVINLGNRAQSKASLERVWVSNASESKGPESEIHQIEFDHGVGLVRSSSVLTQSNFSMIVF